MPALNLVFRQRVGALLAPLFNVHARDAEWVVEGSVGALRSFVLQLTVAAHCDVSLRAEVAIVRGCDPLVETSTGVAFLVAAPDSLLGLFAAVDRGLDVLADVRGCELVQLDCVQKLTAQLSVFFSNGCAKIDSLFQLASQLHCVF